MPDLLTLKMSVRSLFTKVTETQLLYDQFLPNFHRMMALWPTSKILYMMTLKGRSRSSITKIYIFWLFIITRPILNKLSPNDATGAGKKSVASANFEIVDRQISQSLWNVTMTYIFKVSWCDVSQSNVSAVFKPISTKFSSRMMTPLPRRRVIVCRPSFR